MGTCRGELQQAKMKSQAGQPHDQSAQGLRQSLERELQQQVTQLEVSIHVWKFHLVLLMHCLSVESQMPKGFLKAVEAIKCSEQ